jgi:hypothetical protein
MGMEKCDNCEKLEVRIRELKDALRRLSESAQESEDRMAQVIAGKNRELTQAKRKDQEVEDERYWREDRLKDLERAHERGDRIDQERITQILKRGW